MRDDSITVSGPFVVPDIDVEEYEDEDDGLVPAHTVDMSGARLMTFESRACVCGRLHGYTLALRWDLVTGWPEFAEHSITAGMDAVARSIENCQEAAP